MRPDRIIVGEVRQEECLDLLLSLNSGLPELGSGKSRSLEVLERLVPRPVHAVNATSTAPFHSVADEAGAQTILFDEVGTSSGRKAREKEDMRGMLNPRTSAGSDVAALRPA